MASTKRSSKREQIKKHTPYINYLLSLLLILAGAAILVWASISRLNFRFEVSGPRPASQDLIRAKPVKVYIPKLDRVLFVFDGEIVNGRWTTTQTGVSYLTASAQPGSKGNSVIYGHNTYGVLGGLWRVESGDFIYVVMDDGQFYKYQVFEEREIEPNQVEVLNATTEPQLTIYTCSGFLDSARFVVFSKLQTS